MTRLTLLLALLLPAFVLAQDEIAEDAEPVRRYTVEVIIFTYEENVSVGSEIFVPDVIEEEFPLFDDMPDAELDDALPVAAAIEDDAIEEDAVEIPPLEWVLLEESELTMNESYGRLDRLQAYEPVMYFGWTQPTYEEALTTSIPLHAFGRPPAELDGSLTLYLSRFLHLVVDLQLDAGAEQPTFYRINENRILRNGEVRYFDHPRFGVIAKVSRAEDLPNPDAAADELAGGVSQ